MNKALLVLLCAGAALMSTLRAELRIVCRQGDQDLVATGSKNGTWLVEDQGSAKALAADVPWRIEGEILEHAEMAVWNAPYGLYRMREEQLQSHPETVARAVLDISDDSRNDSQGKPMQSAFKVFWPQGAEPGGVLIAAWISEGKVTKTEKDIISIARPAYHFNYAHLVSAAEAQGQFVLLYWNKGAFIRPIQPFKTEALNKAMIDCALNDAPALKAALDGGLPAKSTGHNKLTLLHVAASAGATECVNLLLQQGADVNAATAAKQSTPLHFAAQKGRTSVVEALLSAKGKIDLADSTKRRALHIAVLTGWLETARLLILKGAKVDKPDENNNTPLADAINLGYSDLAELLCKHGDDLDFGATQNQKVLLTQCRKGHTAMVDFLLKKSVRPNFSDGETNPLLEAAYEGSGDLARLLIKKGAKMESVKNNGRSALMIAAANGNLDFVKALLAAGAKVDKQQKQGMSALHAAVLGDHAEVVEALLLGNASTSLRNKHGLTPLGFALMVRAEKSLKYLIAAGCGFSRDEAQADALIEAAILMDQAVLLRPLIDQGWKAESFGGNQWTPLALAKVSGAKACEELLSRIPGASPTMPYPLVRIPELDAAPKLLSMPNPEDPREYSEKFPEQKVLVEAVITPEGRALFPRIVSTPEFRLGFSIIGSLSEASFSKLSKGGQPVAVRVQVPFVFRSSEMREFSADQLDVLPKVIKQIPPVYPFDQRRYGQMAKVIVSFVVNPQGRVEHARVVESSGMAFHDPALRAVNQWVFEPGMQEGKAVYVRMQVPIIFSITD